MIHAVYMFKEIRAILARRPSVPALLLACLIAGPAPAGITTVAVATNVAEPMEEIVDRFESATAHSVRLVTGSTAKLYAQIMAGAPFDIFLAADRIHPDLLYHAGLAEVPRTYAVGRLVLWSARGAAAWSDLRDGKSRRIAMADPVVAPYGLAARQTLRHLGLWPELRDRIVLGESVGQAFAFVATGNASHGLVALSQVLSLRNPGQETFAPVPPGSHDPIRQDMVRLLRSAANPAADAFELHLAGDAARTVLVRYGYGLADD